MRVAELHVARFTGLDAPTDVAEVRGDPQRAEWINANTESLAGAARAGRATHRRGDDARPGRLRMPRRDAGDERHARAALAVADGRAGRFGARLPRPTGAGPVRRGGAPIRTGARCSSWRRTSGSSRADWSLDPTDFRTCVAIHEVTHRFEFARPWARDRFSELLDDFLSTLHDRRRGHAGAARRRWTARDPEALQGLLEGDEGLFGAELDDEQRLKLGRIQAFMAAAEGYGDHVMHALGAELLPSYGRIEEAMRRYREGEAGRSGVRAAAGRRDEARAVRERARVLRHGGRAHRRGHPGAHVGLGRGDAVAARGRRATPLARRTV